MEMAFYCYQRDLTLFLIPLILLRKSFFICQYGFKIRKKEQAHYVFNIIHFLFLLTFPFFGDSKRLFIGNDSTKG
ncbi:hypothetical protein CKY04_06220 [Photorhabdus sp. S8-52]|nr:hypothetical protein CKY03_06075 [Photorhabdus sp. S9-53]RAX02034.1 hypothetical protein CKY05_05315 [Photorhabdus sp. S10-54]RAX05168.1 hypothetical protein CKY04_06220 [Photorhabdus sp. S8-52]